MTLLSAEFFAIAAAAILVIPLLRGPVRAAFFFVLSALFAASYLTPSGILATLFFMFIGYACAAWCRSGRRAAQPLSLVLLTSIFVYMRGYDFIHRLLPDAWMSEVLATAGLSFLFFKMLHVVIDAAAGAAGELRLTSYVLYCLNFTTFLMGPIQRYQDFVEQWEGRKPAMPDGFEAHLDAMNRVLRGLVKKFVVAELLASRTIHSGMDLAAFDSGELLIRTYLFYLYLYFDFSGYCDVVIGVGQMMGIRPPENFHLPFLSRNVSAYWLRVHRSLTTWLTDYVFNPCFASFLRSGALRKRPFLALSLALMVTMTVAGLWHGTSLAFLLFGVLHGLFLVGWRAYERAMTSILGRERFRTFCAHPLVHAAAVVVTYNLTSLAYLFFVFDLDEIMAFFGRFA